MPSEERLRDDAVGATATSADLRPLGGSRPWILSRLRSAVRFIPVATLASLLIVPFLSPPAGAPAAAAQDRRRATGPRESAINRAYVEIKKRRKQALDTYVASLRATVEECVETGLPRPGTALLDTIERLIEPPETRRKVQVATGVGLDEQGERLILEQLQRLARAKKETETPQPVDPELADKRKWIEETREKLQALGRRAVEGSGGAEGGGTSEQAKEAKLSREEKAAFAQEERARTTFTRDIERLATLCVKQNFPAHAYELLLWALRVDGDNLKLRAVVRQQKFVGEEEQVHWYTPYEMQFARAGYREHPEFGWVKPSQLQALKAGKVWYKGQWLDRDYVERERQDWENAWVHETEHFEIRTNAPLRDAVEFGREVESLYSFFYRVFVDFFAPDRPSAQLVFQGGMDLQGNKLKLHYYRSREHYLENIKKDPILTQVSNFSLTLVSAGFYYKGTGKAYFYRGPTGPDLSVIYHEVTHQIFGQTYPTGPGAPVWLVEGLAVFMEDPIVREERLIAGAEAPPGILKKDIRDINDFVRNHQTDETFHGGERGDNYATGGAVVHFFLLHKGGIYRKGFMRYAREAYRNNLENTPTHSDKLYEYLRVSPSDLQASWEEFNKNPDLFDF